MREKQKTIKIILTVMVFTSIISCRKKGQETIQEVKKIEVKQEPVILKKDSLKSPVEEKKTNSELMKQIINNSK